MPTCTWSKGHRLTAVRGNIEGRYFTFEVILSKKNNRRQLKLIRRPRRSAIAASWSGLDALVDLGSFSATAHILSLNQLEKK